MKTAVVHDWLNGMRGGEKVLESILPLLPEPTIFTLFHVPGSVSPAIERHPIRRVVPEPDARRAARLPQLPAALSPGRRDASTSPASTSSSRPRTAWPRARSRRPGAPHLCYCHTPVRYAYEQFDLYFPPRRTSLRWLKAAAIARPAPLGHRHRLAPDALPRQLLGRRRADPPALRSGGRRSATRRSTSSSSRPRRGGPRGLPARRRGARALQALRRRRRDRFAPRAGGWSSSAADRKRRASARWRPSSVEIRVGLQPRRAAPLYRTCAAYLQPGEEDFGIAAVEALACGAPVVALGARRRPGHRARRGERDPLRSATAPRRLAEAVQRADRDAVRLHSICEARRSPSGRNASPRQFRGALGEPSAVIRKSTRRIAVLLAVSDVGGDARGPRRGLLPALPRRDRPRHQGDSRRLARTTGSFPLMAVLWPSSTTSTASTRSAATARGSRRAWRSSSPPDWRRCSWRVSRPSTAASPTRAWSSLFFFALDVLFVFAGRTAIRRYLEEAWRHGVGVRHVLVVGAGRLGRALVEKLLEHPEAGLRAVGFVDDAPASSGRATAALPVLGTTADAARIVDERGVDTVFLALPLDAHRTMLAVLQEVGRTIADVRVVPDLLQYITFRAGVEDLDGLPVVHLTQVPLTGWMSLVKRTPRPRRSRPPRSSCSRPSTPRSPRPSGSRTAGPSSTGSAAWASTAGRSTSSSSARWSSTRRRSRDRPGRAPDDPRRTRVGAFLRRWSLDELPQLVNVLRGEMSLVGPRPERPEFVREFKEKFPQYMLRHRVRAGITGWAQVHGWRGQHQPLQAHRVRPLLHRELVARPRHQDPLDDAAPRPAPPERVLIA